MVLPIILVFEKYEIEHRRALVQTDKINGFSSSPSEDDNTKGLERCDNEGANVGIILFCVKQFFCNSVQ